MRYDINMSDEELKLERSMPAIDISYAQVDDGFIDKITTTDKKLFELLRMTILFSMPVKMTM